MTTASPPRCDSTGGNVDTLEVQRGSSERGVRLRVDLDPLLPRTVNNDVRPHADGRPGAGKNVRLELTEPGPKGKCESRENTTVFGLGPGYPVEIFASEPRPGTWAVRVVLVEVVDLSCRLRARLEKVPAVPDEDEALKPDLRIFPRVVITFSTPTVTNGPGSPATAGGSQGCLLEDIEDRTLSGQDAVNGRCLRVSAGVFYAGDGSPALEGEVAEPTTTLTARFPARQCPYMYRYASAVKVKDDE